MRLLTVQDMVDISQVDEAYQIPEAIARCTDKTREEVLAMTLPEFNKVRDEVVRANGLG